jgi:hypothetical protein
MERSGTTVPAGVTAAALGDAVRGFESLTAVVSVYQRLERAVEHASQQNQTAWRDQRDRLCDDGAPDPALDAIDELIPEAHHWGRTLAAIADGDGLVHVSFHCEELGADLARVEPLPCLAPLVRLVQADVPHVRARVDRVSAEVDAVAGKQVFEHERTLDDHGGLIRRTRPGGWSQRRYQQRAENLWAEHGREFAETIVEAVDEVGARFVALAGDVRAVQLTRDALPERVRDIVREAPGSLHPDGSEERFAAEIDRLIEEVQIADSTAALALLAQEVGQRDRGAVGPAQVFAALARSQVDTLLLGEDADDDRRAWFGDDPDLVALDDQTLVELGVVVPVPGRAVDVAIRAAIGTGAGIRVVPSGSLVDGFAAVLRFP